MCFAPRLSNTFRKLEKLAVSWSCWNEGVPAGGVEMAACASRLPPIVTALVAIDDVLDVTWFTFRLCSPPAPLGLKPRT